MLLHFRTPRHLIAAIFLYATVLASAAGAQGSGNSQPKQQARPAPGALSVDEADAGETRERRSMERFLSLLERNQRRGTPLDRVMAIMSNAGRSMNSSSRIAIGSRRNPTMVRLG